MAPETIDVELPPDNAHIRRGLLHITKIIQNLANNVRFGKEAHMMCFNDFLSTNIVRVMRFLTEVNVRTIFDIREQRIEVIDRNLRMHLRKKIQMSGSEEHLTKRMPSFYIDSLNDTPTKSARSCLACRNRLKKAKQGLLAGKELGILYAQHWLTWVSPSTYLN